VAWFLIAHCVGRDVTIYGDGKQTRDILFIDDLIDAYLAAIEKIEDVRGLSFNVGGGPTNALSLLELPDMIRELPATSCPYLICASMRRPITATPAPQSAMN
jgi:CDP-paratose 2-epimerase